MLGGLSPLLIFHIGALPPSNALVEDISGIPLIGETLAANLAIPIPIYLDENLTKIFVKNHTVQVDMNEDVTTKANEGNPDVNQRAINSIVTVNMVTVKGSIVASMLIALNDLIFTKLSAKTYSVSYLNGPFFLLNGLVHGFSAAENEDNTKLDLVFQFSKAGKKASELPSIFDVPVSPAKITVTGAGL
jgi:hypothetical protein